MKTPFSNNTVVGDQVARNEVIPEMLNVLMCRVQKNARSKQDSKS